MILSPRARALGLALALVGLPTGLWLQSQGDTLTVTLKNTRLRTGKRLYAPAVCDLVEGDKLALDRKEAPWFRVTFKGNTGWIHESDVTAKKDVRLSGEGVREEYSAAETSAARKGFNPQVEREYRRQNPDLSAAYGKVDTIQGRSIPEAEIVEFLKEGKLTREGGQ
jgi:hypothetical protein